MQKYIIILLGVFLAVIVTHTLYAQTMCEGHQIVMGENGTCDGNPLILVFQDNFDGSSIDLSKWNAINTPQRDPDNLKEKQWYTPANLEVSNGTLKIITRKETTVHSYSLAGRQFDNVSFDYTSAEIDSKLQFDFGYYEIKCKIPKGKGFWPAFWGYAYGYSHDEIDVFEFWNEYTYILGTPYYAPGRLSQYPNMTAHHNDHECTSDYSGPDFSADFHTFGLYRDGFKIQWIVDGVVKRTDYQWNTILGQVVDCNNLYAMTEYISNDIFPRDPMTIIANLAIQNGDDLPDASTPFPSQFEIDYIRYYKRLPCATSPVTITSTSNFNYYFGTAVSTSGTVSLASGRQLTLVGQDNVVLNPGFNGNSGCNFVGRIEPCGGIVNRLATSDVQIESTDQQKKSSIADVVNVFPNPTSGRLNLEVNFIQEKTMEYSILSPLGKVIFNADLVKMKTGFQEIDLSNEPEGIYIIKIISDSDITYKKIILTK